MLALMAHRFVPHTRAPPLASRRTVAAPSRRLLVAPVLAAANPDLTAQVKRLETRVAALEEVLQVQLQKQHAKEQQLQEAKRAAVKKQEEAQRAAERNRARQLNPACTAFWTSRGYDRAPWKWNIFVETSLGVAHAWPRVVKELRYHGDFFDVDVKEWGFSYASHQGLALREIHQDCDVCDC